MPNWVTNKLFIESFDKDLIYRIKQFIDHMNFNTMVPMPETLNIESSNKADIALQIYLHYAYNVFNSHLYPLPKYLMELPVLDKDGNVVPSEEFDKNMSSFSLNPHSVLGYPSQDTSYLYTQSDASLRCRGDLYVLGHIMFDNMRMYRAKDWYDWRINNWGTKWNSSHVIENLINDTIVYCLMYDFDTAWNSPEPIIDRILYYYGNGKVRINYIYGDEGIPENSGWLYKEYGVIARRVIDMQQIDMLNQYNYNMVLDILYSMTEEQKMLYEEQKKNDKNIQSEDT